MPLREFQVRLQGCPGARGFAKTCGGRAELAHEELNMAVFTLGELLDCAQDAENHLEASCSAIRDRSTDSGVRLLTYYLARHRHHQKSALSGLASGVLRHLRKVELSCDLPFNPATELCPPDFAPDSVDGKMLIEAAVSHDRKLVVLYNAILVQALNEELRAVLKALVKVEERDIIMLKKMLAIRYF